MAPYYLFGPKNVGSVFGRSFKSLNGGRRLMSRQTGGVRDCKVNFPAGGVFDIFGSSALLPGKIVMPHTTEGFAGICGEIKGRVGSLGFCAVSGAAPATMTPHRSPKRQVNFIPSSFGFSQYSVAPVQKLVVVIWPFGIHDESAGYWLSREVVAPIAVTHVRDRPAAIAQDGSELRVVEDATQRVTCVVAGTDTMQHG